jgi:hypothetical protein
LRLRRQQPDPPAEGIGAFNIEQHHDQRRAQPMTTTETPTVQFNCAQCGESSPYGAPHVCTNLTRRQQRKLDQYRAELAAELAATRTCDSCNATVGVRTVHWCAPPEPDRALLKARHATTAQVPAGYQLVKVDA